MIRQISRRGLLSRSKGVETLVRKFGRGLATQQHKKETISYNDFPPDRAGIVQNSIYSDKIEIPKCSAAEYIWSNVNGWWDKTAVVSVHVIINTRTFINKCVIFFSGLWCYRS